MYWSVPLYLQELLLECGRRYLPYADNYRRLVDALLEFERVTFVSLNYDVLLDDALRNFHPIDENLNSYWSYDRQLIKLHGSVNWGRLVDISGIEAPMNDGCRALCHAIVENEGRLADDIQLRPSNANNIDEMRQTHQSGFVFYPALAAPLGPDDPFVCPPSHVDALRQSLDQQTYGYGLHLLVLGYSCLDRGPLRLIAASGNVIKSLVIVNGDQARGERALQLLQEELEAVAPYVGRGDDCVECFDGGFTAFATSSAVTEFVERVRAADPV